MSKKSALKITLCHQFKINFEGIRTKLVDEEEWSVWRGRDPLTGANIEPLSLLNGIPELPTPVQYQQLSDSHMKNLEATFGSKDKLTAVLSEFLDLPRTPYTPLPVILEVADSQPVASPTPDVQELQVTRITKQRWSVERKAPEWYTHFSDGSKSWEPQDSFEDSDGTTTDLFKSFCLQCKPLTGPPKPRKRTKTKHTGTKESKKRARTTTKLPRGKKMKTT